MLTVPSGLQKRHRVCRKFSNIPSYTNLWMVSFKILNFSKQAWEGQKIEFLQVDLFAPWPKEMFFAFQRERKHLRVPPSCMPVLVPSLPSRLTFAQARSWSQALSSMNRRSRSPEFLRPPQGNFSRSRSWTKIPRRMFDLFTLHFH